MKKLYRIIPVLLLLTSIIFLVAGSSLLAKPVLAGNRSFYFSESETFR